MVVNGGGPQGHPVEGTLEGGIPPDGGSMLGGPVPNPLGANKVGIWLGQPPPWGPHDHLPTAPAGWGGQDHVWGTGTQGGSKDMSGGRG